MKRSNKQQICFLILDYEIIRKQQICFLILDYEIIRKQQICFLILVYKKTVRFHKPLLETYHYILLHTPYLHY